MASMVDRSYDELLILLIRSGDRKAAERLAARWYPRLLRTARHLVGRPEKAEDAVQETWAALCRSWIKLSDPSSFHAYAFAILSRKCADQLRRTYRDRDHLVEELPDTALSIPPQAEDRTALEQAFATLSLDHRLIALLFFVEGLTLREIAAVVNVPIGTVKSRLFHARQSLQATLKGD